MPRIRKKEHRQGAHSSAIDHVGKRSEGTFNRFQDLPCELRLMVWAAAMTPRLVVAMPRPTRPIPKDRDEKANRNYHEISLMRGIPALFAVNQEARNLALSHYTWRFTIYLAVFRQGLRDSWSVKHERARVIMSPDDTLGIFRCKQQWDKDASISKFRVKVADEKRSPWRTLETTDAPRDENWFKKVAVLGDAIKSNRDIIHALNGTPWDLDSILHKRAALIKTVTSPHTQHTMSIATVDKAQVSSFTPIQPFERTMTERYRPVNRKDLDVIAYKLADGEQGENWSRFLDILSQRAIRTGTQYAVRRPPRW
ncbi:hypothetical protein DHEL01_v200824 [Diaporthe helianthi]|uniref:2EXR domain-containing protein n=1 Tax=Diaporthe helianthi TaxID=158607 RepID=A0A2P5IE64_DIAHE|nr:hypothetical protein DHEL01_v200824 [Diaporthe helianthi]